jgi:hypothetical protein
MADDDAKNGGASEASRRRRMPPPTIDLRATDVSPPTAPTEAAPTEAAAPDPAQPDPPSPEPAAAAAPDGTPPVEPPAAGPQRAAQSGERPSRAGSRWAHLATGAPPRAGSSWAHLATGALGAVLALIVAGGAWALLGPGADQPGAAQADLNARLSGIESQLGTLSRATPAPSSAAGDTKALGDLSQRLAAVDREIKPLSDRIADLGRRDDETLAAARLARERADAAAKSLADVAQQLSQLNAARANAPPVERSDLDALAGRLASLEASTKQIGDQLARIASASNPGDIRQAVVALALNTAVERGVPYRREFAALDAASAGAAMVDALKPFADTGVPSAATLSRELAAAMPEALKSAEVPTSSGGFFDRLQSNAERLVRIRPIAQQPQPGDEPPAILSRIETKSAGGDIAGALAEAAKLPAAVRAPLEPWIKRAAAREAALAAAAALAAQSLDVIRRPAQGATDK